MHSPQEEADSIKINFPSDKTETPAPLEIETRRNDIDRNKPEVHIIKPLEQITPSDLPVPVDPKSRHLGKVGNVMDGMFDKVAAGYERFDEQPLSLEETNKELVDAFGEDWLDGNDGFRSNKEIALDYNRQRNDQVQSKVYHKIFLFGMSAVMLTAIGSILRRRG